MELGEALAGYCIDMVPGRVSFILGKPIAGEKTCEGGYGFISKYFGNDRCSGNG